MRKIASIIFILSANIILLAHAVIPHHHHDHGKETVDPRHPHEIPHHGHERHGDQTNHAFIFDDEIILPQPPGRLFVAISGLQDNLSGHFQSIGLLSHYDPVEYLPVMISDASIPLIASSYTCYSQSSCGLRAPPVI